MAQENMSDRDFAWSIYQHADRLQHQRQYNFATMQAFLFVAVGLGANSSFWEVLVPLVALFGACLAVAWWGATVRLVRPMRAIRRCLETDSVYRVYHSALWKFSASFLVIHLPPTLAFVIWASLLAKALGLAELQGLQYLIPLAAALLLALFLVALERKVESKPPGTDAKQPAPNAAALPPSSGEPGTVNPVVAVILVLFAPSRFVEAAVRHDVYAEFRTNRQWQSAYPDRQVPPEKTQEFRSRAPAYREDSQCGVRRHRDYTRSDRVRLVDRERASAPRGTCSIPGDGGPPDRRGGHYPGRDACGGRQGDRVLETEHPAREGK